MLEITIRQPKEGVCPACENTGVVIPKDGVKRVVEVGRFCSDCEEGRRRWQEVAKVMSAVEEEIEHSGDWFRTK